MGNFNLFLLIKLVILTYEFIGIFEGQRGADQSQ